WLLRRGGGGTGWRDTAGLTTAEQGKGLTNLEQKRARRPGNLRDLQRQLLAGLIGHKHQSLPPIDHGCQHPMDLRSDDRADQATHPLDGELRSQLLVVWSSRSQRVVDLGRSNETRSPWNGVPSQAVGVPC